MVKDIYIEFKEKKFAPKHLSEFANIVFEKISMLKSDERLYFDLSTLVWIATEELVYLSALFHHLKNNNIRFYIQLRKGNDGATEREAHQIINLWSNWKIHSFLKRNSQGFIDTDEYFDITDSYITFLRDKYNIKNYAFTSKKYNWHKVTPFTSFKINSSLNSEEKIYEDINDVFVKGVDDMTKKLLTKYQSETPFENKTISSIITKELYENSIDHAFENEKYKLKECYFGLSLKNKFGDEVEKSEFINSENFKDEEIEETENFFKLKNKFKNQSLLQFTFVDFGLGIPNTLRKYYSNKNSASGTDNSILEFAFNSTSSRHPISNRIQNRESITRGLFGALAIVKQYKGLIVTRSNFGKVIFDFSNEQSITESTHYFGKENDFFDGTLISIYIPENKEGIEIRSIKPTYKYDENIQGNEYISISSILKEIFPKISEIQNRDERKSALYDLTLDEIDNQLDAHFKKAKNLYIDFAGCPFEERPIKKILLYLASTYQISENRSAIIVNPPDKKLVLALRNEITAMEMRNFIFHPIPCIYQTEKDGTYEVIWIGITDPRDEIQLNQALSYEINDKRKIDFENPEEIEGNIFKFDKYGNLIRMTDQLSDLAVESYYLQNTFQKKNDVYITAGNYYQYEYVTFLECLQNKRNLRFLSTHLFNKIDKSLLHKFTTIVAITLSSQLLARGLKDKIEEYYFDNFKTLPKLNFVRLSNYHSFANESPFESIGANEKILLVCDVIATGGLVLDLKEKLEFKGAKLITVASLADTRTPNNKKENEIQCKIAELREIAIISLTSRPITKYNKNIKGWTNTVRINPITNGPNTLSISKSEIDKVIYKDSAKFIKRIKDDEIDCLKIGNFEHNQVNHSYFVEIGKLLSNKKGQEILAEIIKQIREKEEQRVSREVEENAVYQIQLFESNLVTIQKNDKNSKNNSEYYNTIAKTLTDLKENIQQKEINSENLDTDFVFFPIYSGLEEISENKFENEIFKKNNIYINPCARINTAKGWRFTFPPKFLNVITKNKSVFILDDGSCTGDTILQMIDEVCYLDVKRITVLSVIGRVEDFQREFLTRLKEMKVKKLRDNENEFDLELIKDGYPEHTVPVHIYFGVHLHIPVYNQNPLNPFWNEKNRLEEFLEINNIPQSVEKYIYKRLRELKPTSTGEINKDSIPDYLPRFKAQKEGESNKSEEGDIPIHDLFYYRDQIGKLSGYRFFNEYFDFFIDLLAYYEKKISNSDRYKRIELMIGVLLHEPNLIQIVKDLLPDLFNKIREFIEKIILTREIPFDTLFFKWERYALIKFLFVISIDDLLKNEQRIINLYNVFKFAEEDSGNASLEYLSFAFFNQMTHFRKDSRFYSLNELINNRLIQLRAKYEGQLTQKSFRIIDKIESYCNTNPFDGLTKDTHFYFEEMRKLYRNEVVKGIHHGTAERKLNILDAQVQLIKANVETQRTRDLIYSTWSEVKVTLEIIVKYCKALKPILKLYNESKIYNLVAGNDYCLESLISQFDDILYEQKLEKECKRMEEYIKYFSEKIILINSPSRLFFGNYKCDILSHYVGFADNYIKERKFNVEKIISPEINNALVDMHEVILQNIFLEPILSNLYHADKSKPSTISLFKKNNEYILHILSPIDKLKANNADKRNENKNSGLPIAEKYTKYYKAKIEYGKSKDNPDFYETTVSISKSK